MRYKIAPNRLKTIHRPVITFEEKKQSIAHLFKTFSGLRLGCNVFILAKRSENTVNWTFLKISAVLNARFRVSYFKLKVNGRAVTSQTDKQPIVEVGSVCVCAQGNRLGQISISTLQVWNSFSVVGPCYFILFEPCYVRSVSHQLACGLFRCVYSSFQNRLDLIREPAFYWVFYLIFPV